MSERDERLREKLKEKALAQAEELGHDLAQDKDAPFWVRVCKRCKYYVRIKEPCYGPGPPYLIGPAIAMPCERFPEGGGK